MCVCVLLCSSLFITSSVTCFVGWSNTSRFFLRMTPPQWYIPSITPFPGLASWGDHQAGICAAPDASALYCIACDTIVGSEINCGKHTVHLNTVCTPPDAAAGAAAAAVDAPAAHHAAAMTAAHHAAAAGHHAADTKQTPSPRRALSCRPASSQSARLVCL